MPASNLRHDTITRRYGTATIAEAARLIGQGLPVAIPTETVYGLAADATNGQAVALIYTAKGRPSFNPLIVHVLDLAAAEQLGVFDPLARALAKKHWPGPLTLVVPQRPQSGIADLATAGLDTIAIRVPEHRAMRALIEAVGRPLAAPSANESGGISPTTAGHVLATLNNRIPLIVDDGETSHGLESTIVIVQDNVVRLLRPGPVVFDGVDELHTPFATAPGQLPSHYAPKKPLRLNVSVPADDEWMIGFGPVGGHATLSATGNLVEAAARLFAMLHIADDSDLPAIAVAPVPSFGLGIAINDRLARGAYRTTVGEPRPGE